MKKILLLLFIVVISGVSYNSFAQGFGVNTATPRRMLDVLSPTAAQMRLSFTDNTTYTDFQTQTNGYLIISPTGKRIGLGTTTPGTLLHISDASNDFLMLQSTIGGDGNTVNLDFQTYGTVGGVLRPGSRIQAIDNNWSNHLAFYTKTPGDDVNALVERMRIQNDGNIGIGTNAPEGLLHLQSASPLLRINGNSGVDYSATLRLAGEAHTDFRGGFLQYDATGNNLLIGVHDAADELTTSDIEAISIERATGRVGIGLTDAKIATLTLSETADPKFAMIDNGTLTSGIQTNGNGVHYVVDGGSHIFKTGVTYNGDWMTTGTERMRITNNGGVAYKSTNTGNVVAGTGITAAMLSAVIRYTGAGAVDITANPQIADGTDGQIIIIIGTSDVNTLILEDGNGLNTNGTVTLGSGDTITLIYDSGLDLWLRLVNSNN